MEIDDIGSTDDTALLCHTNHPDELSGGNWVEPKNIIIPDTGIPGFTRNEGRMVMRLRRTTGDPPEGLYTCLMEGASANIHTVYIGLYNSGRGMYIWQINLLFALHH